MDKAMRNERRRSRAGPPGWVLALSLAVCGIALAAAPLPLGDIPPVRTAAALPLALTADAAAFTDAITREFSAYNDTPLDVEFTDAITREFSAYNDTPLEVEFTDAITREFSAYNDTPLEVEFTDAITREFSAYNDTPLEVEFTDAITREFSAYNDTPLDVEFTDAITREFTATNYPGIGGAKQLPDGAEVNLLAGPGVGVSAVFDDCVYVEAADRSSGIKLTGVSASEGQELFFRGTMRTGANGERYVEVSETTIGGTVAIRAAGAATRTLWCGDFYYNATGHSGQQGMANGHGLNVIGQFLRTWGTVQSASSTEFTLDDGFGRAVNVLLPAGAGQPDAGSFVVVTGVLSCEKTGELLTPVFRPRRAEDIVVRYSMP